MMNSLTASLSFAAVFAAAGYVGAELGSRFAQRIAPLPDAPPQERVPKLVLIVACAAIGAIVAPHAALPALVTIALVCACLVAIWVTDARRGIVPDVFTLAPLGIMLLFALVQQRLWLFVISAAVPFIPFAIAALASRGRGMGWGDVKLAALGGALLGAPLSILAFVFACLAAGGINYARGRKHGPIAFAPYLAAAIGVAIPLARWS